MFEYGDVDDINILSINNNSDDENPNCRHVGFVSAVYFNVTNQWLVRIILNSPPMPMMTSLIIDVLLLTTDSGHIDIVGNGDGGWRWIDRMMAVAMVKYSINKALKLKVQAISYSHNMGGSGYVSTFRTGKLSY